MSTSFASVDTTSGNPIREGVPSEAGARRMLGASNRERS